MQTYESTTNVMHRRNKNHSALKPLSGTGKDAKSPGTLNRYNNDRTNNGGNSNQTNEQDETPPKLTSK